MVSVASVDSRLQLSGRILLFESPVAPTGVLLRGIVDLSIAQHGISEFCIEGYWRLPIDSVAISCWSLTAHPAVLLRI